MVRIYSVANRHPRDLSRVGGTSECLTCHPRRNEGRCTVSTDVLTVGKCLKWRYELYLPRREEDIT